MKTVKRLVICLTCLVVLLSSFPYVSAAEASENDNVFYEYDENGEAIAEYYTYHEDYDFQTWYGPPEGIYDPDRGPMMYAASKGNFTWKPDSIDWASFPSHIRAIAYSPYSNISWPDDNGGAYPNQSSYRAPFVLITSNGTNYTIRAGWDVALYYRASSGNVTVGFNKSVLDKLSPVLYIATFKCSNNAVVSDWSQVSYSAWGTSGQMYSFSGTGFDVSNKYDVFTYGANAFISNNAVLANIKLTETENVTVAPYNVGRGILDHAYAGFPATAYNAASQMYITSFTPKAPNSYTVTGSTTFGINSKIITNDDFIFHENLPYGLDSLVVSFTLNDLHNYHYITDSKADVVFLRNWNWSETEKLRVTMISSEPIYRVAYNGTTGNYASMNSASGLVASDVSSTFSPGSTSWHSIVEYYINKGYHYYTYSIPIGNIAISISNNSVNLKIDDTLTFAHSYGAFPTADTLTQYLMNEQNNLINEGNQTNKSIWETLKSVLEYIKNLPTNIANSIKSFFTELGDRISGFFTTLSNNIKGFFDGLATKISGYFTTLQNYLLYFQSTKPEHVNPFANILTDIETFFDKQMSDVGDFKKSLNTTLDNVVGYISSGSGIINQFLTAAPLVSAFVTFFVVFCIVRKVVGR